MRLIQRHVHDFFKAISRSIFFDEPWVGAGFLALLCVFDRSAFLSAMIGALIGYGYSVSVSTPRILKSYGLIPVNGMFFGLAMASLFEPSRSYFLLLCLGALAIPIAAKALLEVLQHWKLSPIIGPYVLAVWVVWLCREGAHLDPKLIVYSNPVFNDTLIQLVGSSFYSMANLMFLNHPGFGVLMLVLISLFSPRRGLYFFAGSLVATVVAHYLFTGVVSEQPGLYSYSAGLVGLGLASFPEKYKWHTILFFCALSAVLTLASIQLLGRMELPILSLPYLLTMWLAQLSRTPRVSVNWIQVATPNGVEDSSWTSTLPLLTVTSEPQREKRYATK